MVEAPFKNAPVNGPTDKSASTPLIIGLTGGIGSGKSTVAKAFKALDIASVDADYASRAVVEPGMPALQAIEAHFGPALILPDGTLNRSALRDIIFADAEQKTWLESLLHPLIRDWILTQLQASLANSPYVILESPLLFETDQHQLVSTVILVDVPVELQLERAAARDGNTADQIQSIINAQMSREDKLERADTVFDNSLSEDSIAPRVLGLHQQFLARAVNQ
ncbi:MAG TPA: dephospho-CoA kinase [Porticoccaceae bacterium]|nr:dephospho-CoA kinase [Porticoccaceae bacterium]